MEKMGTRGNIPDSYESRSTKKNMGSHTESNPLYMHDAPRRCLFDAGVAAQDGEDRVMPPALWGMGCPILGRSPSAEEDAAEGGTADGAGFYPE